jgi:uncharacterized membrane protein
MARQVLEYARTAQTVIAAKGGSNPMAMVYMEQIQHYAKLSEQVIRQTQRRVIDNEKVPAQEKIVSIFVLKEDLYARLSRGQLGDAYDFMLSFFTNSILYSPIRPRFFHPSWTNDLLLICIDSAFLQFQISEVIQSGGQRMVSFGIEA